MSQLDGLLRSRRKHAAKRMFSFPSRAHHLGAIAGRAKAARRPRPGRPASVTRPFSYPTRASLAGAVRRLMAAGIPIDKASDDGTHECVYLREPDEKGLELACARPAEEWPRNPDGSLKFPTKPLDIDSLLTA